MKRESVDPSHTDATNLSNNRMKANSTVYRHVVAIVDDIENRMNRDDFALSNAELDLIVFLADQFNRLIEFSRNNATICELFKYLLPHILESSAKEAVEPLPSSVTDDLSYVCYLCDEEIEITNNDIQFSLRLHLQSSSHLETTELFERIRKGSVSEELNDSNVEQVETASNITSKKLPSIVEKIKTDAVKTVNNGQNNLKNIVDSVVDDKAVSEQNTKRDDRTTISSLKPSVSAIKEESLSIINPDKRPPHQFYCSFCKISFSSKNDLTDHLSTTHKQPEQTKSSSQLPKYICKKFASNYCVLCHETIHSQFDIRMHVDSVRHTDRVLKADGTSNGSTDIVITMKEGGLRHCVVCDVFLPSQHNFDAHVFGKNHASVIEKKLSQKSTSKSTTEVPSTTTALISKPLSPMNTMSSSTPDLRTGQTSKFPQNSYTSSQSSIMKPPAELFIRTVMNKYYCSLCNVYFPTGNGQIENHVYGQSHQTLLTMKSDPVGGDLKPCLVNAHGGGKYCTICNVSIPKGSVYETHLNSRTHLWHLQQRTYESMSSTKSADYVNREITAEMMIGVEDTMYGQFCSLCKIKLPGRSQLFQHTNSPGHKAQVKLYKRRNIDTKPITSNITISTTVPAAARSVDVISPVSSKRSDSVRSTNVSSDTTYARVTSKLLTDDKQLVVSKRCDVCELDLSNEYEYSEHLKSSFHKLHAQLEETQVKIGKQNGQDLMERIDAASNFQAQVAQNQQYSAYVGMPLTRSQSQLLQRPEPLLIAPSLVPVASTMSVPQIPPLLQNQFYLTSSSIVYPPSASITHSQPAFSNPYVRPVAPSTIGVQQSFVSTQLPNQCGPRPTATAVGNTLLNGNNSNLFNETVTQSAFNGVFNGEYEQPKTECTSRLVDNRRLENGIIQKEDKSFYCMYCNTAIPCADGFEAHISTEIHFSSKEKSREDSCAIS